MKGEQIADLIVEWADERRMHPDDFSDIFVEELFDLLNKDKEDEKKMKAMKLFEALDKLSFDQVLVQVNNVEGVYHSRGDMIYWDKENEGRLTNYWNGNIVDICKTSNGQSAEYIFLNISEIEGE